MTVIKNQKSNTYEVKGENVSEDLREVIRLLTVTMDGIQFRDSWEQKLICTVQMRFVH